MTNLRKLTETSKFHSSMTREQIDEVLEIAPWLKDASFKNAIISTDGKFIKWESGTWESGIWESGTWESGSWESGTWENGTWEGGIWENGIWYKGTWESGISHDKEHLKKVTVK